MSRSTIRSGIVLALLAMAGTDASAQDVDNSTAGFVSYEGAETLVLMVLPDGSGPSLTEARILGGGHADATIEVFVRDWFGLPVEYFSWRDVWLSPVPDGGTLATCPSSLTCQIFPDPADTGPDGRLVISGTPWAGGYSEGLMQARINNTPLTSSPGLNIRYVSPDIDGNLVVNLSDAGFFANDLFGDYHFRSDFDADGDIDLSDAGFLATSIGKACF